MRTVNDQYKVVTKSKNTNSFGLRQLIVVNRKGEAFKIHVTDQFAPEKDKEVTLSFPIERKGNVDTVAKHPVYCDSATIEMPERILDCPPEVVKEIFAQA